MPIGMPTGWAKGGRTIPMEQEHKQEQAPEQPKAERRINRLSWLIGGAQGSGVDSAANVFARACAHGGLYVLGQREYYSNIMGEHSYYQVRVSDQPLKAIRHRADLLVSFDAETVFVHAPDVAPGGGIVYDPKLERTPLERVPTLSARFRDDMQRFLEQQGVGTTLKDLLSVVEKEGVGLYPIPYDELLQRLAEELQQPLSKLKRAVNTLAVAASTALLGYGVEWVRKALEEVFRGKAKVVEANVRAAELAYAYVAETFGDGFRVRLEPVEAKEARLFLTGTQAVALGKILAGCSVQTYYPISPATDESVYLESHQMLRHTDGGEGALLVLQTEDEIAAIDVAIGAAIAGARAATSTSGPGFSLMVEGLGFAMINEVPVVITLYQRGSPSTGMPTRTEQGDLRFVLHAGHGEGPRIVLASGDLEEAFYDEVRAFNWAEKYQLPVIHLLDKALASTSETRPLYDTKGIKIERGKLLTEDDLRELNLSEGGAIRRFLLTDDGISPRTLPGTEGGIFWLTSDEHDEWGHITEDPVVRDRMMEKRMRKLETAAREIPREEKLNVFGHPTEEAEAVVISWGSPKGAILEAMELLGAEGFPLKFVQVRLLWPFPAPEVAEELEGAKKVIAVENNFSGQLAALVREQTGVAADHLLVKYNGRPMTVEEVYEGLRRCLLGGEGDEGEGAGAPRKVVLTHGR